MFTTAMSSSRIPSRFLAAGLLFFTAVVSAPVAPAAPASAAPRFYPVSLPKPTGPHAVGHDFAVVVDRTRVDPLNPLSEQPRRLPVHFWYPAVATPAASRRYVTDRREVEFLAEEPDAIGGGEFLRTNADEAAPPAKGRFPVLLFSPGFGAPAEAYQIFAEQLASAGYVVAAVHSPGVNGLVTLDGEPFDSASDVPEKMEDVVALNDLVVADLQSVLVQVKDGRALPTLKLVAALDLTRIGALGHSFGGSAAVRLAGRDSTVRAAVNLDGTIWGEEHATGLATNALFLKSGENTQDPSMGVAYANLKGRGIIAVQPETAHNTFGDSYYLYRVLLGKNAEGLTDLLGRNAAPNLLVTRQLLVAYFNVELKQHAPATLTRFLAANKARLTAQTKGF